MSDDPLNTDLSEPRAFRVGRLISRWTWIAGVGILAGGVGFLLSLAIPAEYEASASLSVGVDYPRTPPLDALSEARVLERVANLLASDNVVSLTAEALPQSTPWSEAELRQHIRLDRRGADWRLVGRGGTPELAADVANAWMQVSLRELDEAMDHAWRALELQDASTVVACSEMSEGAPKEFLFTCLAAGPNLDPLVVDELRQEIDLSRGLLPIVSYEATSTAQLPTSPVAYGRGPLIVGAALAGMIVGALLAGAWPETVPFRGRRGSDEGHPA